MENNTPLSIKYFNPNDADEFFTEERCHILELLNSVDDRSQSIARARVEVGTTTAWHRLINTKETILVKSGTGSLELNEDDPIELKTGDLVRIPENTAQRVSNTGEEDLVFYCFCIPAFGSECYESLE